MSKKLLCLDSNSIFNRAYYGIRLLSSKDGVYTNAIFGFLNILNKMLGDFMPDYVCCAFDLKGPTFRHQLYEGYKAQRKGMPEELAMQLPYLKELLPLLGYRVCELEGYEADDIIGTMARRSREEGMDCVIVTGDRDSLQLIGEHVNVCLAVPKNGTTQTTMCDEAYVMEKYGVTPELLIDIKALMGDASDNIPGVPGIGEKGARELVSKFGSIDDIYANIDSIPVSASLKKKLTEGRELAFLSRQLGIIEQNVPLEESFSDFLPAPIQHAKAYELLSRLEIFSMIDKFGILPPGADGEAGNGASPDGPLLKARVCEPAAGLAAELAKAGSADILPCFGGDTLTALAVILPDAAYLYGSGSTDALREAALTALRAPCEKRVCHAKKLYRLALAENIELTGVVFDVELAAYLLSPSSSRYSITPLAAEYGALALRFDDPDLQAAGFPEGFLSDAALISPLSDALAAQIDLNGQHSLLLDIEIPLAQVLASMELLGFEIDAGELTRFGAGLDSDIERLTARIYELAGGEFNINSPKQLGVVLFDRLGLPTWKKTKSGYSTNAEVLDSLRSKHPIVDLVLEYRTLTKLKSTYVEGLLGAIAPDGRIHTSFNQTETRTGRISSTEPNMQNIPVRTELGSRMRRFFKAREGCVLVDADYSQIELRVLAHVANDEAMLSAFRSRADIHTDTAARVFGLPPEMITPLMRSRAKAVNFGIVYGIGAYSLSQDIGVSIQEAGKYIDEYLNNFSGVKRYMSDIVAFARENGYVQTMFGRRRPIPEINASNKVAAAAAQRIAMNTPIQGTAADIIKIAMVRVYNSFKAHGLKSRLILQVHDELIAEAVLGEEKTVADILKREMENAAQLLVPLEADTHIGKNWYDAKQG